MALVFGVGTGLFSVILVVILGLIACAVFSRAAGPLKNAAPGVGILVIIISISLYFYPRRTQEEELASDVNKVVDGLFIPKVILFTFMVVFALVSVIFMLLFHWMEPIYTPALQARKSITL